MPWLRAPTAPFPTTARYAGRDFWAAWLLGSLARPPVRLCVRVGACVVTLNHLRRHECRRMRRLRVRPAPAPQGVAGGCRPSAHEAAACNNACCDLPRRHGRGSHAYACLLGLGPLACLHEEHLRHCIVHVNAPGHWSLATISMPQFVLSLCITQRGVAGLCLGSFPSGGVSGAGDYRGLPTPGCCSVRLPGRGAGAPTGPTALLLYSRPQVPHGCKQQEPGVTHPDQPQAQNRAGASHPP